MDITLLTEMLKGLEADLWKSSELLKPVAIQLLGWFFMFELTTGLLESKPGTNPLEILIDKMKRWAYLYAFIYFFDKAVELIEQLFNHFYTVATGDGGVMLAQIPEKVLQFSMKSIFQLWDKIEKTQPATWLLLFGILIGVYVFGMVAMSVGMALIEYLVMKSLVIVLIPFMMFKKLSFVGDKVVGTLINLNMKLFVIKYLLFFFQKFLSKKLEVEGLAGMEIAERTTYWLIVMAIFGLTTTKGHELAQALISGTTTFGDASQLVGFARSSVVGMVSKAYNTMRGTAKAGQSAGKGAMEGMKAGYQKGISGSIDGMKAGYNASGGSDAQSKGRGIYADIGGASGFAGGVVGAGAKGAVAAGRAIGKMFRKSGDSGESSQPLALGYSGSGESSQPLALGYSGSTEKTIRSVSSIRPGNSNANAGSSGKRHRATYKRI